MADDDRGAPIAYMVLTEGTPVQSADGEPIGTVSRVLADTGADIFDGLAIDTADGERFVDAPEVAELYEQLVVLTITAAEAQALPEHSPAPAVLDVSADDVAGQGDTGAKGTVRKVWDRLSGNY